jgi:hypothetical protein
MFQSDTQKVKSLAIQATRGLFTDPDMFITLYGDNINVSFTYAFDTVKGIFHTVFRNMIKPADNTIRPFLLFSWSNAGTPTAESNRLTCFCLRSTSGFNSEATFFHARYTIMRYTNATFGRILADAVGFLFDSMYDFMVQYIALPWKWVEDYLVQRLNRAKKIRQYDILDPHFCLDTTLRQLFTIDPDDLQYFMTATPNLTYRKPCECGELNPITHPAAAVAAARITFGRNLKAAIVNRDPSEPRTLPCLSNEDWPHSPNAANTGLCTPSKHPCYYWAHQNDGYPCPNVAGGAKCPHPHAWPDKLHARSPKVVKFMTWLRADKLL